MDRRISTRGIRGPNCQNKDRISGCRSTLTRTVWDGDQVLFEIRVRGDSGYGQIETDYVFAEPHYGTVGYLHAGGIDQPLALWKGTQLVLPHANWRGAYVKGSCPADPCDGIVWFPAAEGYAFGEPPAVFPDGPGSWHGSLIESGQDASGYQYRRNRYADPRTGRFTQEDPIGLAGGLNLYGFANGDPVTFSDPFGLCPEWLPPYTPCVTPTGGPLTPANASTRSGRGGSEFGLTRWKDGSSSKTADKWHSGFDDSAPLGAPLYAAGPGMVTYGVSEKAGVFANLDLGNGFSVSYSHLDPWSFVFEYGSGSARAGQLIGWVGNSGNAKGSGRNPHAHITTRKGTVPCNPRDFLSSDGGGGSCK